MKLLFLGSGYVQPWLRMAAVAGTGYFLIATSSPGDPNRRTCVDGIAPPQATLNVGPLQAGDSSIPSCEGYDGLSAGVSLPIDVRYSDDAGATSCHEFEIRIGALPSELISATLVSENTRLGDVMTIDLSLEKPTEPGCRFDWDLSVNINTTSTNDDAGLRHFNWAGPVAVVRTLSFPQVQFCSGTLGANENGAVYCRDAWSGTLNSP